MFISWVMSKNVNENERFEDPLSNVSNEIILVCDASNIAYD